MAKETERALILAGGAITLITGAITILAGIFLGQFFSSLMPFVTGAIVAAAGIWGAAIGLVLVACSRRIKRKKESRTYSIVALIFSILGIVTFQGIFIGPLLALIGSLLAITSRQS